MTGAAYGSGRRWVSWLFLRRFRQGEAKIAAMGTSFVIAPLTALLFTLSSCAANDATLGDGTPPDAPAATNGTATNDAQALGADLTSRFQVPDGLAVTLWAESPQLFNPAAIDVDARGRVWVAEAVNYRKWDGRNPGRQHAKGDRIVILEDSDGDGTADTSKVFVQDAELVAPLGIAVIGDSVYVSCSPNLFRYVDANGDDIPDSRETLLTGFGGADHDHGLHSVVAGPDGRLWFNAGNAGPHIVTDASDWTLRSGSIYNGGGPVRSDNKPGLVSDDGRVWTGGIVLSVLPDGSDLRVHADNFRNIYEVALDSFGNFYEADNDDDGNRGCRTLWCLEFGNHGYLSADGTRTWQVDRRPEQDTQTAHWHQDDPGVAPAGTINGAGGPTGLTIYEGELLADSIGGALLNCDAGAGVVYAHTPRPEGAGVRMVPGELLRPRAGLEDPGARWFRPSDVAVGTSGEVYVCDWYDPGVGGHAAGDKAAYGRILRVAPRASSALASPTYDFESLAGVLAALASPAVNVRSRGLTALDFFLKSDSSAAQAAGNLLAKRFETSPSSAGERRLSARLFGLSGIRYELAALEAGADVSPELFEAAVRAMRRSGELTLSRIRERSLAEAESPAVRREVSLALRDVPLDDCLDLLLQLAERFDGTDRTYLEALGLASEGREEALYGALAPILGDDPLAWDARAEGLAWRLHPAAAIGAHTARAMNANLGTEARRRAIDALAFSPTREAASSVVNVALSGPADLRSHASWWFDARKSNEWRSYELATRLGSVDMNDAELVWDSGVVRSGVTPFELDITDAEKIWLIATDAGDGNSCDWADWIEPTFQTLRGPVAMTDVKWFSAEAAWGSVHVDKNTAGGPLAIDERSVRGIGTHANSTICCAVPSGTVEFVGGVGPDDGGTSQGPATSIRFQVWVERPTLDHPIADWASLVLDNAAPREERIQAAVALARDPGGALRILALADANALPEWALESVRTAIHANPDIGIRALASEHFPPPGADGPYPSIAELSEFVGDPRNGRRIFQDQTRSQCATCHAYQLGDTLIGGDVGPELTRIGEKYDRGALFDAILNPNAGIPVGYETWLIETSNGLLHNGFILADGPNLILKDTRGNREVIPADEIVARTKQTLSTMPNGVALDLQPQELADLVSFLQQPDSDASQRGDEIALFDGSSLDAWTAHLGDANANLEDVWHVQDGVLKCEGNPIGYLRTQQQFENFELSLEWRFDPERGPGNSGVLLRTVGPDKVWPKSIEAQLQSSNAGDFWNIDEFAMSAQPARTNGRHTSRSQPSSEFPLGEWNRYDIRVDGPRVELRVNGILQNTADWCDEVPGYICLQSEGAYIEFRDIRVTPLVR